LKELDTLVLDAKSDQHVLENLIKQNEQYIVKCASKATHRYITKSDDEWSIALLAFHQAVKDYQLEKGSFLSFAELVIKRRLIDYIRSQGKYIHEVSVDPVMFDTEPEEETDDIQIHLSVAEQAAKTDNNDIKYEITAANQTFSSYGFSFFDLSECSPRAEKTKKACAKAVNYCLDNTMLVSELRSTKQLSLKIIEKNASVPRKILERHRRYIIAAIEILSGGYPYLAEYMRYIREGNKL